MDILEYIYKRFDIDGKESPIQLSGLYRQDFDKLLGELELNEGCEVGVLTGRHAKKMMDANLNLHLHLVDSYKFYAGMPKRYYDLAKYLPEMRERLSGYNYTEHIMFSMEAINEFEDRSLDFVYIDASHRFDFIMRDIIEWSKKVKIGGIVSGHDYKSKSNIGVNQAVNAYIDAHNICPIFITTKKKKNPDTMRTFFWIKE